MLFYTYKASNMAQTAIVKAGYATRKPELSFVDAQTRFSSSGQKSKEPCGQNFS